MFKEIVTCDGCDKPIANRKYFVVEIRNVSSARGTRLRRSRYRSRNGGLVFADLCKDCMGGVVSKMPCLRLPKQRSRRRS
jgi:hypothetical protein